MPTGTNPRLKEMERKITAYIKEADVAYMRREASIVSMLALIERCKRRIAKERTNATETVR